MSIINQMLRDLDARGGASADSQVVSAVPAPTAGGLHRKAGALLLFLAAGAAAGWMLGGRPTAATPPVAAVAVVSPVPARHAPVRAVVSEEPGRSPKAVPPAKAAVADGKTTHAPVRTSRLADDRSALTSAVHAAVAVAVPRRAAETTIVRKVDDPSPEADAQEHYEEAQRLRRAGNVDAALAQYRQALERNPGLRAARIGLAGLLQEAGQAEAALTLLKTGYERQPDDTLAIVAGRLLADLGRRDEALLWLGRAQAGMRPADAALMGALLSQAKRYDEAVNAYQRALAAEPYQGGWLLGMGLALEALGRFDEARPVYRHALERGSFKPEVVRFLQQRSDDAGS